MTRPIALAPVDMTPAIMQMLEDRGLIIRLHPGRPPLPAPADDSIDRPIYESDPAHGPHKLIAVTVNTMRFNYFGAHDDNEEFLLIGDPGAKPMYLVVALCRHEELARKIAAEELTAADLVALRVRYNDAEVSFFTMLKGVPHGEVVTSVDGVAPHFFVTEPRDIGTEITDWSDYQLQIVE